MTDTEVKGKNASKRVALGLAAFVVCVAIVLPRFRGPASREVNGTVTQVDVANRRATLEFMDSANGTMGEVTGEVPESCLVTIDGAPAVLSDVRVGDAVVARALIERRKEAGNRSKRIVAEELRVTRAKRENP